ncbi:hypothetical protein BC30090_p319 (plasmid) [Bacillus cereus]|uniref:hypothetical protein n=1 Tax=Bacillus TaxID=1386 RepID=UPI001BB3E033|nr:MULTISPECIES: hypothetical protein [Bacillus]BCC80217.1 hypothetical protein BCJMU62_p226 [Bacillus cereus]BCD26895.1 hypothetical protein BC30090_p319 [Bacillus cereus]GMB79182.1 hypothetical protein BCER1_55830 [Bacillus cereus]
MREKREYMIPRNVRSDFEVMKNVTVKDTLFLLPAVIVDVPLILSPASIYVKIPISIIMLLFPVFAIWFRPVRENVPFWKHARDVFNFLARQKTFYFRKEVETYEIINESQTEATSKVRREEKIQTEVIGTGSHSA